MINDFINSLNEYSTVDYNINMIMVNNVSGIIGDVVGVVLGITAIAIVLFMTIVTTFDIAYVTMPTFRETYRKELQTGNDLYLRAVSSDAVDAVEHCYINQNGEMPLVRYITNRFFTYIKAAIILFLIVGGSSYIQDMVAYIVKMALLAVL